MTKHNIHFKVKKQLEIAKFEYYIPFQKQLKIWADRKKKINVPIFQPYFFIYTDLNNILEIRSKVNHVRYIIENKKYLIASFDDINKIKKICNIDIDYKIEIESVKNFNIGDEVEISSGYFRGFKGTIIENLNNIKYNIYLSNLNFVCKIEIEKNFLKKEFQ